MTFGRLPRYRERPGVGKFFVHSHEKNQITMKMKDFHVVLTARGVPESPQRCRVVPESEGLAAVDFVDR